MMLIFSHTTHAGIKIYRYFYHGIIYMTNEWRIVIIVYERICAGFFYRFVYIWIDVGNAIIKNRMIEIPLTGLKLPCVNVCPHTEPGPDTLYIMLFCIFSDMRWEVIVNCWYRWNYWLSQIFLFIILISTYRLHKKYLAIFVYFLF